MKTQDLTGAALDWAVEFALLSDQLPNAEQRRSVASRNQRIKSVGFSTNWSLMGPIIEREHISLNQRHDGWWVACIQYNYDDEARSIQLSHWPLISAARCFVASKLGDDVEIPDELLKS
jgi:hypothetical protein